MKRFLLAAFAAMLVAPAALSQDKVSIRLNWLIYGFHTPFLLGVDRGIYRDHGIDLTVGEGQGSARAVQIVAAGSDTFGASDGSSIIAGAVRGAPIRAVMGIMNQSPFAVIVRRDSGITEFKGLAGQTIAATTGEAGLVVFPALLRANGMAADAVRFLRVDGAGKLVSVLEKRAVGMVGGIENQALILASRGADVLSLPYATNGVNSIGLAIHATEETIRRNPDMVRRFIAATAASFALGAREQDASISAGVKLKPDMDRALALAQLQAGLSLMRSLAGPDRPIGWMAAADWDRTLALMKEFQDLQTDKPASAFWTDQFLAN